MDPPGYLRVLCAGSGLRGFTGRDRDSGLADAARLRAASEGQCVAGRGLTALAVAGPVTGGGPQRLGND